MITAVLLVDTDLGFLFWLGRALDEAGYEAFPAKSVPDAKELLAELPLSLALLIINFALPGARELVTTLRQSNPHLRVMALVESEEELAVPAGADAVCRRPVEISDESKTYFLDAARKVLSNDSVVF